MIKKVGLIIQARMGSSRLPGKSMMDLAGAPLVGRILERVKRCVQPQVIILAIPDTAENKILASLASDYGVEVFAGSEHDLVERYYQAANFYKVDTIVRLPADNATPEPSEIDKIIAYHHSLGRPGFTSNLSVINNSGYPDGIGAEVFDFSLLAEARLKHFNPEQREHVHLNFYNYTQSLPVNVDWCPVGTLMCPLEFRRPDLVLDVNTLDQYKYMRALYEYLYPINSSFDITDIIKWNDEVYRVN